VPDTGDRCEQVAEYGGCSELLERWFWDQNSGRCDRFWYSGCEGNDNNFITEADCDTACNRRSMTTTTQRYTETDIQGTACMESRCGRTV